MNKLEADKQAETIRLRRELADEKIRQQKEHRANIEQIKLEHKQMMANAKADQEKDRLELEKECFLLC